MRLEPRLFLSMAVFYVGIGLLYWFTSYEPAGTVMLAFAVGAWALVWAYLVRQRRDFGLRPEDVSEITSPPAPADVGYFPSSSAWPFGMGVGAVVAFNGLVFGSWLILAGGALFLFSVVGMAVESQTKA
jgi:hypothetical protein